MKTLAITRHVEFGSPPQAYSVTFHVGSRDRQVKVVGPGRNGERVTHWIAWHGPKYRPGCLALTEQAIVRFLELQAQPAAEQPDLERGNDELVVAARLPFPRRVDFHERQLPASDRLGVG